MDCRAFEFNGSNINALKGQIDGVNLVATDLLYKGLTLDYARLNSGPLDVNFNILQSSKGITLLNIFRINGYIDISEKSLSKIIRFPNHLLL